MGMSLWMALVLAQAPVGPHYRQAQPHRGEPPPRYQVQPLSTATVVTPHMKRRVYGYLPYWVGVDPNTLRWDVLTDVVHFDVQLSTAGAITSTNGFASGSPATSTLVSIAHAHGARAHFAVTVASCCKTFLESASAKSAAITHLVTLAQQTGADGINIDFEFVSSTDKASFTAFIQSLATQLHAALPNAELTLAMPAYPPWYPGYDVAALAGAANRLLLMEYDFHYSGSGTAGPVAPLTGGSNWAPWVKECLSASSSGGYLGYTTAAKLALGVPYYGYDWPTASATTVPSSTNGSGAAVIYKDAVTASAADGARWDAESLTPWYGYTSSSPHQVWWDDKTSLADKYDYVNQQNLNGVMIWALGYDSGRTELWDLLKTKFGLPDGGGDAGVPDAGSVDAGAGDAGPSDAGQPDAGLFADAGSGTDGGLDAGPSLDAGASDAGAPLGGGGGLNGDGPVTGGCGVAPVGSSVLLLLGLAFATRRRRA